MIISNIAADDMLMDFARTNVNYVFLRDSNNANRSNAVFIMLDSKENSIFTFSNPSVTNPVGSGQFAELNNRRVVLESKNSYIFKTIFLTLTPSDWKSASIDKLLIAKVVNGIVRIIASIPIVPSFVVPSSNKTYEWKFDLRIDLNDYSVY
jgi:hypothetical protein